MKSYSMAVFTIAIFFGGHKVCSGQQTGNNDPFAKLSVASPTTAALLKFTDIPVSGFTGLPSISIPLYEISTSFTKVPVSLDYHASGITVGQEASNVGLGWALTAGGVLSRSVLGKVDDASWKAGRMNADHVFNIEDDDDYPQWRLLSDNSMDGVPDLYMYNMPGYSGKFIDADQIRQLPMTNLRITKNSSGLFDIVTPDGNKYIFDAVEGSRNKSEGSGTSNIVGWYLTKILSADRSDSIVFTYATTRYDNGGGTSFVREVFQGDGGAWNGPGSASQSTFTNTLTSKQLTKIAFRDGTVEFNISWNTRQDIANGDGWAVPLVTGMVVKNKAGTILRNASFRYDYFTNNGTGPEDKRLKLSGVYLSGGSSTDTLKAQRYNLIYNGIMLPNKGSFGQDHWGYYNGADGNTTLIPSYTNCVDQPSPPSCYSCAGQPATFSYIGADREANGAYAAAGMLERMIYPTGGYTSFEWEPHDVVNYETPVISYQTRGIGSTGSYPTSNTFRRDSSADYYVDPAANPNGICATFSGRMNIPAGSIDDAAQIDHAAGSVTIYKRAGRVEVLSLTFPYSQDNQYNLTTNLNLEAGQSYFVVTEVRTNGFSVTGNLTGKVGTVVNTTPNKIVGGCRLKKLTIMDPVTGKSIVKSYQYRIPSDTAVSSGRLYKMPLYNKQVTTIEMKGVECSNYILRTGIRLSSNSLITLGSGSHIGYTYVKENIGEGGANGYNVYNYENGSRYEGEFNPSWRNGYLKSKTTYSQSGQVLSRETNKYSLDSRGFTPFHCSTIDYFVAHQCAPPDKFSLLYPVFTGVRYWFYPSEWMHLDSTITDVYDTEVTSRMLTSTKAFSYDNVLHLQANKIVERNSEGLDLITGMKYPLDYILPAGTLSQEAQAIRDMQTTNIHQVIETYQQKKLASQALQTRGATYSVYRSVASSSGPVVLFDKQYSAEIGVPSGTFVPSFVSGTGITKSTSYVLKATATKYDAGNNISEAEKQGGDVSAYIWDYNRGYMVAQFRNARQPDVAYSSFEADGKGNWTYAGAASADATTITGKNCYNMTGGAISKTGLNPAASYTVSYWTKNAAPYAIAGTMSGYPIKGETTNGWTYYEHKVGGQSAVTISGTGFIDELRLYPVDGLATTYTYDPMVGVTSVCNEGNKTSYYLYDSDGRLAVIKDQDGKILKQIDYQYQASITK